MSENNPNIQRYRTLSWFKNDGDKTLRLDYDLNKDSIVFDIGGYLGESTANVYNKFKCKVFVFEPVESFSKQIEERFKGNKDITVFNIGLSNKTETQEIFIKDDKSSTHRPVGEKIKIHLKDVNEFLEEQKITKIDLVEINIEAGEYPLLERLIETGKIDIIDNLQVQFHDFIEGAEERMKKIRKLLSKTHYPTFAFDFVWENWKKKPEIKDFEGAQKQIDVLYDQILKDIDNISASRKEVVDILTAHDEEKEEWAANTKRLNDQIAKMSNDLVNMDNKLKQSSKTYGKQLEELMKTKTYKVGYYLMYPFRFIKRYLNTRS